MLWNQITEMINNKIISAGGIVTILGTIFLFIFNAQPITALTSTKLEKVLFTKERRASVRIVYFILQWIISCIATLISAIFFYSIHISFSAVACIFLATSITYLFVQYIISTEKTLLDKYLKKTLSLSISVMLLLAHIILIFIAFPSFFAAIMNSSKLTGLTNVPSDYWLSIGVFAIIICGFNILALLNVRNTLREFSKKINKFISEGFYINEKDSSVKWYIYHPIDKDNILLGNKEPNGEATEFRIIERKKVLDYTIKYIRIPKATEDSLDNRGDYNI